MASLAPSSAATDEKRHRFSFLHRSHKRSSESLSTLGQIDAVPQYEKHAPNSNPSDDDSDSVSGSSPPNYDTLYGAAASADAASIAPSVEGTFRPTLQLQLDAHGKTQCSAPGQMPRPDPINVYMVSNRDGTALYNMQPVYVSLRAKRSSNSCTLVAGGGFDMLHGGQGSSGQHRTLSTTTYRVGPGRPPRIALFDANDIRLEETNAWDYFEFSGKSIFNRVQILRSRLGTFEWRYATRDERKALSAELIDAARAAGSPLSEKDTNKRNSVNNLMILERVVQVFGSTNNSKGGSSSAGKPREVRRPVARLIRSKELRTPGSSKYSAGNGGRLQLDLSEWMAAANEAAAGDSKTVAPNPDDQNDRDMVVTLAVATCISMLKKEVDRRQGQEIAAIT